MKYYRLKKQISIFLPIIVRFYSLIYSLVYYRKIKKDSSVVLINTHDKGGGAAKISFILFSKMSYSCFFVFNKKTNLELIHKTPQFFNKKVSFLFEELEKLSGWLDFSKIDLLDLLKNETFLRASIIHIHNTHGFYFSPAIMQTLFKGKKIIWTLHDDFILTGHCSFTRTCEKWKLGCGKCPDLLTYPKISIDLTKKIASHKLRLIKQINPIFVCPSDWLRQRVEIKYPFLRDKVKLIYNGIDTELFKPISKSTVRLKYGIDDSAFVILFVAELSTKNPFKGGEIIREIANSYLEENTILLSIGGNNEKINKNHLVFPYIDDELELVELYNIADVMVYPTRADNLPLVVLESMSCGIPVIASNVGGIPEIIDNTFNGFLIDNYYDFESFIHVLNFTKNLSEFEYNHLSNLARKKVVEEFNEIQMLNAYRDLQKSILDNSFQ